LIYALLDKLHLQLITVLGKWRREQHMAAQRLAKGGEAAPGNTPPTTASAWPADGIQLAAAFLTHVRQECHWISGLKLGER
jgi:hypothetical protein